ncbi:hypothetical protein BDR07DRAFT_1382900 [Suillus spraguei]|nr:hypothetical protein BDR07DRAFT_1382900 [Suillus spraguei]
MIPVLPKWFHSETSRRAGLVMGGFPSEQALAGSVPPAALCLPNLTLPLQLSSSNPEQNERQYFTGDVIFVFKLAGLLSLLVILKGAFVPILRPLKDGDLELYSRRLRVGRAVVKNAKHYAVESVNIIMLPDSELRYIILVRTGSRPDWPESFRQPGFQRHYQDPPTLVPQTARSISTTTILAYRGSALISTRSFRV